jgi:hypothetical protein
MPPPELLRAFLRTDYRVDGPLGEIVIRIGEFCPHIPAEKWAYLTACNPRSERLSDEENRRRTAELEAKLRDQGFAFWPGESIAWDGSWPAEPSYLVLGISRDAARRLGQQLGQWAIVVGGRGRPAELLWLDDGEALNPA